jgi:Arc/MetJ-type ribon-helix-helix transcriptional regulator
MVLPKKQIVVRMGDSELAEVDDQVRGSSSRTRAAYIRQTLREAPHQVARIEQLERQLRKYEPTERRRQGRIVAPADDRVAAARHALRQVLAEMDSTREDAAQQWRAALEPVSRYLGE